MFIKAYDAQGLAQFPIELSKGRLPQTDKEVVISEAIAMNAKVKYELGDRLTLRVGKRFEVGNDQPLGQTESLRIVDNEKNETLHNTMTRDYTVVGFIKSPVWEPAWAPGYTAISYVNENLIGANDRVNAVVVLQKSISLCSLMLKIWQRTTISKQSNIITICFIIMVSPKAKPRTARCSPYR